MKYRPIVYRTRLGRGLAPIGTSRPPLEERESIGVEQVAAVCWKCGEVVFDAAVYGPKGGEQPGESVVATFQHLFTEAVGGFAKLIVKRGDRVVFPVDRVGHREQIAFLRKEEENQP